MFARALMLQAILSLLGSTNTLVVAMSIANQDLERYFHVMNASQQSLSTMSMTEERIAMDVYTYAFLEYSSPAHNIDVSFPEEKARYGEGKIMNVRGKLVHITDADDPNDDTACNANIRGTRRDQTPLSGVPWIALVRRGRCTFEEKVKNVYAKGASGVIIYNDKPVMNLEKMQIKGKNRNITAVITHQDIGIDMARIVDQGIDMYASITEGRSGIRPISSLNRTSVLFVSISFIVLMIISLVWLIFYYIQRFRYLQTKDQQSRHLCSVTKKAIMKIPTKTGKSSDERDADSDCCAICIEAYKPADCIRVLPCKHEFHKNCIDPWLIEHRTCPMCKLDVLKFYGYVFLGSEESILEYEPERAASAVVASTSQNGVTQTTLLQSRDFVIDFPRVFVLEAGSSTRTAAESFAERLPHRSQSSMSLANAKDWMSLVSNKLDDQQGLSRGRKTSVRYEMQQNLLGIKNDESAKKRRSRSADARYSTGLFGRRELLAARPQYSYVNDSGNPSATRRVSDALRYLTDSVYAQSKQRQREELLLDTSPSSSNSSNSRYSYPAAATRRRSINNNNNNTGKVLVAARPNSDVTHGSSNPDKMYPAPVTIQINGEGVDLE